MRGKYSLFAGFAAAQRRFAKKYCRGIWDLRWVRLVGLGIPTLVQGPSVVSWRDINGPQLGKEKYWNAVLNLLMHRSFHVSPSMIVNACYYKRHATFSTIFLSRLQPRHLLVQNLCKRQSQRWKSPRNLAMFCRSCSRDFSLKLHHKILMAFTARFSKDGEYQWQNGKPSHREREAMKRITQFENPEIPPVLSEF